MLQLLAEAEPRKKARVYRQLGWLCHATRQRSDQSPLGHLHMAVGADADDAQNWHLLGRCLTQHGQHASAYDALQRAIAIDALAHEIWASLGALYVAASSLPDARIAYHRAVLLNPLSEAWLQLGHVLEAMHARSLDPAVADEASHAFAQALPLLPQHEREIRSAMHNLAVMRDDSRRRAAAAAAAQGPAAPRAAEAVAAGARGSGGGGGGGGGTAGGRRCLRRRQRAPGPNVLRRGCVRRRRDRRRRKRFHPRRRR